jgi:hypothetical protein
MRYFTVNDIGFLVTDPGKIISIDINILGRAYTPCPCTGFVVGSTFLGLTARGCFRRLFDFRNRIA